MNRQCVTLTRATVNSEVQRSLFPGLSLDRDPPNLQLPVVPRSRTPVKTVLLPQLHTHAPSQSITNLHNTHGANSTHHV